VVEVHGGSLTLVQAAGEGARFRIWLPLAGLSGEEVAPDVFNSDNRSQEAAGYDASGGVKHRK